MNTRSSLVASLVLGLAVTALSLSACQSDSTTPGDTGGESGSSGTAGTAGTAGSAGTAGTAGSAGTGGTAGSSGSGGTAGSAGSAGSNNSCVPTNPDMVGISVADAANPAGAKGDLTTASASGKSAFVSLEVQATTPKFLVSKSKSSGSCLWGFFATNKDGSTGEYSGIQIVGYGAKAVTDPNDATKTICPEDEGSTNTGTTPTGAGWIPNTLKPGDIVAVSGFVSEYPTTAPSSGCDAGAAKRGQRQISLPDQGCVTVTPGTPTFTYHEFTSLTDINMLADMTDETTQLKWAGSPIKLTGPFTAIQGTPDSGDSYADGTAAVTKYGDMFLQGSDLRVTNAVLFKEVLDSNDHRYDYTTDTTFNSFSGIFYRDFCGWVLSTTKKCGEIDPPASTCP